MPTSLIHKSVTIHKPSLQNGWAKDKKGFVVDHNTASNTYMIRLPEENGSFRFAKFKEEEFEVEGGSGKSASVLTYDEISPVVEERKEQKDIQKEEPEEPHSGIYSFNKKENNFVPFDFDQKENDPVNHPSHYTDGAYEVIDYIEDHGYSRNFCLGNAVKYISRAGKKDLAKKKEDLEKAVWYLKRYIHGDDDNGLTAFFRVSDKPYKIPTDLYIIDKGLEGTLSGLALEILDTGSIPPAIHALELEIKQFKE